MARKATNEGGLRSELRSWVDRLLHSRGYASAAEAGSPLPRLLLVDDDPCFGKIMGTLAHDANLEIQCVSSLHDRAHPLPEGGFDVAIIDYELENITGLQLAEILQKRETSTPVILISSYGHVPSAKWPKSVVAFVNKSEGPYAILAAAVGLHKKKRPHGGRGRNKEALR